MSVETEDLTAGRALDALVAEKVMGWELTGRFPSGEGWRSVGRGFVECVPQYSTRMDAAWLVVEHMRSRPSNDVWENAMHSAMSWAHRYTASEVATAICRASLAAITVAP